MGRLRSPDWYAESPQTGEIVRGHENDVLISSNYPGYPDEAAREVRRMAQDKGQWAMSPMNTLVRVRGEGDIFVGEALFHYPDGPWHAIMIVELKDGLVTSQTNYWARPFDPPEWRAGFVDRIPAGEDKDVDTAAKPAQEPARTAAIRRHWERTEADSVEARRALAHEMLPQIWNDDVIQDLPQSGERVNGLANVLKLVDSHPDFPAAASLRRIRSVGDLFVVETRGRYATTSYSEVLMWEFSGDKVAHAVEYYAEDMAPPAWRAQWVELI